MIIVIFKSTIKRTRFDEIAIKHYRHQIVLIDFIAGFALCGIISLELFVNKQLTHFVNNTDAISMRNTRVAILEICINFLFICCCNIFLSKTGYSKDNVKIDNQTLGTNGSIIIMCLSFIATIFVLLVV